MLKRTVFWIALRLLLMGTLTLTSAIQTIKAESQGDIKAVVLDSWGADYYGFTIYPLLDSEWSKYGSIPIVIDYTSLNKESITYNDIAQSEADVLIISHAYPQPEHIFTNSEIGAIKQYVEEGHGIIGTYGTLVPENNRKLAELFGMNQSTSYIFYPSGEVSTGVFNILDIAHPLFVSLLNPFSVPTASETIYVPSHDWTFEGVTDGAIAALTTDSEAAIIVHTTTYKAIYFTNQMEEYPQEMPETSVRVFYNAIVWASPSPIPPPLSASMSPLSASILVVQSVIFTSTVSAGYTPYSYQWHLNGAPVSGATSNTWTFTPTTSGIYYIYLKVTDAIANTAQSETACITVSALVHDITILNVNTSKTIVCQGFSMNITATVQNQGDVTENCDVTAYAHTTAIETREVTLSNGDSMVIAFTWNTTGFEKYNNYTIRAYAHPVLGETDLEDNEFIDGIVVVTIVGDLNADKEVEMKDLGTAAKAFGSYSGHERWNPAADINNDDKVDMKDIGTIAKEFGKTALAFLSLDNYFT